MVLPDDSTGRTSKGNSSIEDKHTSDVIVCLGESESGTSNRKKLCPRWAMLRDGTPLSMELWTLYPESNIGEKLSEASSLSEYLFSRADSLTWHCHHYNCHDISLYARTNVVGQSAVEQVRLCWPQVEKEGKGLHQWFVYNSCYYPGQFVPESHLMELLVLLSFLKYHLALFMYGF